MKDNNKPLREQLIDSINPSTATSISKVALSALGGIPIAGSILGATGTAWSEIENNKFQKLLKQWLLMQEEEINCIGQTLEDVMSRIDNSDEIIRERVESKEYLSLVKKCIHDWNATGNQEKRKLIRNLLVNATSESQFCGDDILKMFIRWIDTYSELHFRIIREIHNAPGITRYEMWEKIYGETVRDDSAEADLFKLIVHELTTGYIIRQFREKDAYGNFLKNQVQNKSNSRTLISAFDDEKEYHLTELGRWFIYYTMNEVVAKLEIF